MHIHTRLFYLQLKHVNSSARKNLLLQLFYSVDNLDLRSKTPFNSIQLSMTDKGRESKKVKIIILC